MDDMPGPSTAELRAASANLMIDRLGERALRHLEDSARLQRYYVSAEAVGVGRVTAAALLEQAQGNRSGSTPTEADLDAAHAAVIRLVDGQELTAWAGERVLRPWGTERG